MFLSDTFIIFYISEQNDLVEDEIINNKSRFWMTFVIIAWSSSWGVDLIKQFISARYKHTDAFLTKIMKRNENSLDLI